tara:strand:+ start:3585 stop:3983 length:399 start_codon:yes stop_codon:yes gene_type:complete
MLENPNLPIIAVLSFHAIVFLQSGIDKIVNWKGNLEFITQTLSKVFSNPLIKIALLAVTVLETLGGLLSTLGIFLNIFNYDYLLYAQIGLSLCTSALLVLLIGQRISQNYEGAKTIAIYFVTSLIGLILVFS